MDELLAFIQDNRPYFDLAHAMSSIVNVLGWTLGVILILRAWRANRIQSVSVGPLNFQLQEEAITAATAATRDWKSKISASAPEKARANVDVARVRHTIERAFEPAVADHLIGRSILWVDDNPTNNTLAVRAFDKLRLDVEQVTSTEDGLAALDRRTFDLIISDMGRGTHMTAGYDLLAAVRARGLRVPFFIFASEDKPEHRKTASERGAQLSTNDMLELIDQAITVLGQEGSGRDA